MKRKAKVRDDVFMDDDFVPSKKCDKFQDDDFRPSGKKPKYFKDDEFHCESRMGVEYIADIIDTCTGKGWQCIVDDTNVKVYVYDKADGKFTGTDYLPEDDMDIQEALQDPELMFDASGDDFKRFAVEWNGLQKKSDDEGVFKTNDCMPIHGKFNEGEKPIMARLHWTEDGRECSYLVWGLGAKDLKENLESEIKTRELDFDDNHIWVEPMSANESRRIMRRKMNESRQSKIVPKSEYELESALGDLYLSSMGKDEVLDEMSIGGAIGHHVIGYAYTDYGGDEFDRMVCDYIKNHCEDAGLTAYVEPAAYNGANCVIWGEYADRIVEAEKNGELWDVAEAIGFDLDDAMTNLEEEFRATEVKYLKGELGDVSEEEEQWLGEWLENWAKVTATGLDYSYKQLESDYRDDFGGSEEERQVNEAAHEPIPLEEAIICHKCFRVGDRIKATVQLSTKEQNIHNLEPIDLPEGEVTSIERSFEKGGYGEIIVIVLGDDGEYQYFNCGQDGRYCAYSSNPNFPRDYSTTGVVDAEKV